ncbi:MAG: glycoside hydrolase family 3 N-terminal domain-containing protein [Bacteroidota bacterium]
MNRKTNYHSIKGSHPLIIIFYIIFSFHSSAIAQTYLDSTANIEERTEDLLSRMTLDEKIGQMVQVDYPGLTVQSDIQTYCLGSVLSSADAGPAGKTPEAWADLYDQFQSYALGTRLKIPILFGIDAVHGIGSVYGATIFPHNIGMGCTRNPSLVTQAAQITAQEMAATGINWTFGPVVAVARNENWGRTYESFGEEPNLVKEMSASAVLGFQGDTSSKTKTILACAKHFIGDGGTTGGQNGGNTQVDTATLRAIHLPGYLSAIEQKAGSIMVSQSTWNGAPCHGNHYLLTTLLKEELKFKGILITDYSSFLLAVSPGAPYGTNITTAVNAGIDMAMMNDYGGLNYPNFIDTLRTKVNQGIVSMDRIDDAVRRILTQKFQLGLFEHPYAKRSFLSQVGSPEHRQVARECVRQSLVVLKKKDGVLPISKTIKRIHIAGRHANDLGYQCGGWTITWQGGSGNTTIGTTILQAVQQAVPSANVTYSENGFGADSADIGIVAIGELPYAEASGDGRLTLDPYDIQTVRNMKTYNIPIILILITGRPVIINPILHHCDALIAAWLPGTEGQGITDVLFGDYPPVGTLSQTWPRSTSQIPINIGDAVYDPLFAYGYGITSLNDSPPGSAPVVYSASTTIAGQGIEISFNKMMAAPPAAPAGFSVLVNGITPANITLVSLKSNDSTTIVLTLGSDLVKGSTYTVSYTSGNIQSCDGGQVATFENFPAYNILNDYSHIHVIPKKLEAEQYLYGKGIGATGCSDVGGGLALTPLKTGNWTEYLVNVSEAGSYKLVYRISSLKDTGQVQLIANGVTVSTLDLPVTGSWYTWQSVSTTIELSGGPQILRMYASRGGFQLNWMEFSSSSGIEEQATIPECYQLYQNHPNPFNPTTTIGFSIPKAGFITLKVYNVLGAEVATLVSEPLSAGIYSKEWNAFSYASGVYFYRLQAGNFCQTKKLILLK